MDEYESFASETDIRSTEMLSELETKSSAEYESLVDGSISPELESETESYSTEHEMEDELETLSSGEDQVLELLTEFDAELFKFTESELRQALQSELSQPYTPEAVAFSNGRMISEAYDRFVNALAANPSSFHLDYEQFAPAVLAGVRVAFRTIYRH
jgi:hypothetical protein